MSDQAPKRLQYKCPNCGTWGTFGEHYCTVKTGGAAAPDAGRHAFGWKFMKYLACSVVAILLILSFSLGFAGYYGPLVAALALATFILVLLFRRGSNAKVVYRKLHVLCGHDTALAERLIQAEVQRHPDKTRAQATADALGRLENHRLR